MYDKISKSNIQAEKLFPTPRLVLGFYDLLEEVLSSG